MLSLVTVVGLTSAFVPPASVPGVQRVAVSSTADISMAAKKGLFNFGAPASPTKPVVSKKATPLSPGSNYPSTKNIMTQSNGFGTWLQKFQTVSGKVKKLIAKGDFELAGYIRKKIGEVGSGKDYYQS